MDEAEKKTIWCEDCQYGPWRHVLGQMWLKSGVSRSGLLKVPARCHACEEELPVGSLVEAVTVEVKEDEAEAWVRQHLAADET